jgi:hypothetical protein
LFRRTGRPVACTVLLVAVRIVFDGWFPAGGRDVWNPIPRFRLLQGEESVGIVVILLSRVTEQLLLNQLGLKWEAGSHQEPVSRAVLRFGVREIERRVRQRVLPTEDSYNAHEIAIHDVALLAKLSGEKECEYQVPQGRDLYCLAVSPTDETARWVIEGHGAAPTSRSICAECALPDTDYLCSNFSHAELTGIRNHGEPLSRDLLGGLCQAGRPEIDSAPGGCRPDGHACWERRASIPVSSSVSVTPPLQLPEAVDYLDTVWRLLFGRDRRVVRSGGVADIAALMLPCHSREEFESRLSDLADLLKRLDVAEELLPEGSRIARDHTLERVKATLLHRTEGVDADEVESAVSLLQAANRIRIGQQHAAATRRTQESFDLLGVDYPTDDWGVAWSKVRSAAADCFLRLAHVVRRLEASGSLSSGQPDNGARSSSG